MVEVVSRHRIVYIVDCLSAFLLSLCSSFISFIQLSLWLVRWFEER